MTGFFMAWQMFLWIPCPSKKWDDTKVKNMLLWLPVIGIIAGALWYLVFFLFDTFGKGVGAVAAAVLTVFPWLITGFMHLDGYMDCADAALYFGTKERKLEILKDSHVGSFAVIAAVILGILQFAAFLQIGVNAPGFAQMRVLIFIPALSRCFSVENLFWLKSLSTSEYANMPMKEKRRYRVVPALESLACFAAVFYLCRAYAFFAVLIGMAVEELIIIYLRKNLGGFSGDVSGAAITAGELACLIALAFI